MSNEFVADPTRLIIAALCGLAILLFLIIKIKMQAFPSILISALAIGLISGMPLTLITDTVTKGMGETLKGIALLVGLGSMFGAILEISGGAERVAVTMIKYFGEKRAGWALGLTGMVVAIPVFFDAGLIILIPLAFSIARKAKKSVLFFVIPLLAGLAVGHAFIPPTPGPILVANILGVDLGIVIGLGLICGTFALVAAGPLFGTYCGKKFDIPVPLQYQEVPEIEENKMPSFGSIVLIILVPLMLILINSVLGIMPQNSFVTTVKSIFSFLGTPFVALLIATIIAWLILGVKHGYSREELEKVMTKSLEPTGLILLVTAGGGVLRYMLQDSGLGEIIGNVVKATPLPIIVVAFIIALAVRISVGSATVAMTMAAGIVASMPMVTGLSQLHLACLVMAIAGGSTAASHFNDSGFWLVKSLCNLDEKTTFKTWTLMETIVGCTGFLVALVISIFA
ncbi:GntP family permease [Anaerosacchariphilus polymeriproducens]|uniref:Gluconate permease n=1 Tax=Anaerosacchariphilus polymeriproducens TaxID=1812858 RepID=A0A371AR77_9FIRM|nr:gluconate:H+ symporter [Anaerosacchariphilus polymeriproducens]RDU22044.1 gluconate permease [Anaerosacchariphilus polymeriproducens]